MGDDFAMGYAMGQDNNGGNCNGNDWFGGGGNGALTRAAVAEGFQYNNLENGIRGIQQGLCDGFYAMNTGLLTGFNGVQGQIANLAAQNAACCCETQRLVERGFCDVGYAMATNTSNIIQNSHSDTDRVIAKLDAMENARMAEKLDALRSENLALRFQASQANQNAYLTATMDANVATILRRTGHECPTAAYIVQPPTPVNFPVNGCGTVQFGAYGGNGGCGCG